MKSCLLTLFLVAFAAADVSHLSSHYLPPAPTASQAPPSDFGRVTTTIEQHELRELPEQIEYMREEAPAQQAEETNMPEDALKEELTPPEAPMEMLGMPATRYLPPLSAPPAEQKALPNTADVAEPKSQVEQLPEREYLAPEMAAMPMAMGETQQPMMPATRYLPPSMMLAPEDMQPNYQQYQEQFMREQMSMEQERMAEMEAAQAEQYMMEAMPSYQQPEAPTDVETLAQQVAPAHELRDDGYHYKTIETLEKRLRH